MNLETYVTYVLPLVVLLVAISGAVFGIALRAYRRNRIKGREIKAHADARRARLRSAMRQPTSKFKV